MNLKYVDYYKLKKDKKKVKELYIDSFPEEERCPFLILLSKVRKNKGEFYAFYDEDNYVGLIYNIVYKDLVYIYYLAIDKESRNKGYGTRVLTDMKEMYKDKKIILMAETLDPDAENYAQRKNRNKFYLKNGFVNQGYIIEEFGVAYDMLGCSSTKVLKAEFKELIRNYFGNWFFNKIYVKNSNIEE